MQVLTVTQVLGMEDGQQVMAVQGIIDSVYQQNTGENNYGPWSLQNIWLKDPADPKAKIKVKLGDHDPVPPSMRGKQCYFACTQGAKGWTGLGVKLDEYKGKTSLILNATKTCEVAFPGQPDPAPQQQTAQQSPAKSQAQPPAAPPQIQPAPTTEKQTAQPTKAETFEQATAKAHKEAVMQARAYLGKTLNAMKLCIKAVHAVQEWHKAEYEKPIPDDQVARMVSTFFIKFDRQGLVDGLPSGDISPYLPKPKSETK